MAPNEENTEKKYPVCCSAEKESSLPYIHSFLHTYSISFPHAICEDTRPYLPMSSGPFLTINIASRPYSVRIIHNRKYAWEKFLFHQFPLQLAFEILEMNSVHPTEASLSLYLAFLSCIKLCIWPFSALLAASSFRPSISFGEKQNEA